jgi:hypothetical protein
VKGLPYNLQDDDFFNSENNNMVVLDDFMTEAKNDKRISQLFTRTSHHKNVIIFLLLQNLFPRGKESRDIALNSHYVTLFNSPVDRQQVNAFARRIYPNGTGRFLSVYDKAMQTPYGNLTVDLKPSTKEENRLQDNVLENNSHGSRSPAPGVRHVNAVKQDVSPSHVQINQNTRLGHTVNIETGNDSDPKLTDSDTDSSNESDSLIMAAACTDCGVLINNMHDLQRHIKTWCPINKIPRRKRTRYDEDSDNSEDQSTQTGAGVSNEQRNEDEWQTIGLQRVWQRTYDIHREHIKLKREKYEKEGKIEEWIENKLQRMWEKEFISMLSKIIEFTIYFSRSALFRPMLETLIKMDPNTSQQNLKDKIKNLMKPMMKEVLSFIDIAEEESESEPDTPADDEMSD